MDSFRNLVFWGLLWGLSFVTIIFLVGVGVPSALTTVVTTVVDAVLITIWFLFFVFWGFAFIASPYIILSEFAVAGRSTGKLVEHVVVDLLGIPIAAGLVWGTILFAPSFIPSFEFAYKLHNVGIGLFPRVGIPKASVRLYSIVEKPHDCEFGTAPLGNKHCHYEPAISTESGVPVGRWDLDELFDRQSRHTVSWNRVED